MYVRKFRVSDAKEVARMHRNTIRFVNSKNYPQKQIDVWSRISAKRLRDSAKTRFLFVAINKDKIVGFSSFSKEGEITGIYVHKDYQRKGVGYSLLKNIEKSALKRGIKKLFLYSTITANNFYKRYGYKIIKKTKFPIKNQKLIVYRMAKKLN